MILMITNHNPPSTIKRWNSGPSCVWVAGYHIWQKRWREQKKVSHKEMWVIWYLSHAIQGSTNCLFHDTASRDDSLLEDKKVPRSPNKQKILEKKSETIPMGGGLASNKAREKMCSVEVKLVMSSMGSLREQGSTLQFISVYMLKSRISE